MRIKKDSQVAFYNESKFAMWRACVAIVWIDVKVTQEEQDWVMGKIHTLKFTEEQKEISF